MQLDPYTETWDAQDPHANFKADVAHYTIVDPLPTLEGLSRATGVPVPCLVRYVLVKYAASNAEALMAMGPLVLRQMLDRIDAAESAGTTEARLQAYEALKQIISWLQTGMQP